MKLLIKLYLKILKIRCFFTGHKDNYQSEIEEVVRCSKCGRIDMEWSQVRWEFREIMKLMENYDKQ